MSKHRRLPQAADTGSVRNVPFVSESQRRWMYANEPEMAKRWQKVTPKGKKLPKHKKKKRSHKMRKRMHRRMRR
jgi:hypothetical protein